MPFLLLLGIAGLVAYGISQSKKTMVIMLDDVQHLPQPLQGVVQTALTTSTDPVALDALAATLEMSGYKTAATRVRARARMLRGQDGQPPTGLPTPQSLCVQNLPEPLKSTVSAALVSGTNPEALDALAAQLHAAGCHSDAEAATARAKMLRGTLGGSLPPTSLPPGTTQNIPEPLKSKVEEALATSNKPAALEALAVQLRAFGFPQAAAVAEARAMALRQAGYT